MGTRVRARLLSSRDREVVDEHLAKHPAHNLLLSEMVQAVGRPTVPSELPPQVAVAWRGGRIEGVASIRPSVVLDHAMSDEGLEACLPLLGGVESGLIKSRRGGVDTLWHQLRARGRRAMIDRGETAFAVRPESLVSEVPPMPEGAVLRLAQEGDLEDLVHAARASLREEDRPDPFDGDPSGFRRWVKGRLPRARLVAIEGRPVFVGYADVRRPQGWLIQGVYTWPEHRRRGLARAGMAGMVGEAFAAGAEHVQLAVVDGNAAAVGLYTGLGFAPFCDLRTILYV